MPIIERFCKNRECLSDRGEHSEFCEDCERREGKPWSESIADPYKRVLGLDTEKPTRHQLTASDWIPVEEALPEPFEPTLVIMEVGDGFARVRGMGHWNDDECVWEAQYPEVSHWIPMPPFPERKP